MLVSFVFSANQKAFVICTRVTSLHSCYTFCTRVTEELHSFLSQSELSNFFVYIINRLTSVLSIASVSKALSMAACENSGSLRFLFTSVFLIYLFYLFVLCFLAHGWRSHAMGFWRHSNGTRSLTHSLTHSLDSH